ncbi:hypothetical protein B0H66DRAFT_216118 [Apodospora peruviana]|uniref:Uncharacterized protein n=1 Tax=Apodospora peruviana TaxID=516989 RepID=A0AAE0M8W8_9PEZI|nr:hypothetical protein B0H66DRAFT_216118 [Apodospora peruviana]
MANMSSQPEPDKQSITEAVVRLFATHIFGLLLYGHLGSLTKVPSRIHVFHVVAFLFFPAVIIAQVVINAVKAFKYARRFRSDSDQLGHHLHHPGPDFNFYLQGILGVRAIDSHGGSLDRDDDDDNDAAAIPLFEIGHLQVRKLNEPFSWAWFGRVLGCLVLIAQAVGTCLVFIRRQQHGCDLAVDMTLGVMAFSSAITGLISFYLLLARLQWTITQPVSQEVEGSSGQLHWESFGVFVLLGYSMTALLVPSYLFRVILLIVLSPLVTSNGSVFILMAYCLLCYAFRRWIYPKLAHKSGIGLMLLLELLVFDVIFSIVFLIYGLSVAKEGCWKDPLSDIIFVV